MLELNKIYCMDCLEGMKQLEDNSIDLIITDPPYNIGKSFANEELDTFSYNSFIIPILNEFRRIIKPSHSIIIFFDSGKNFPLIINAIKQSGLIFQKLGFFYKPNDCSYPHNRTLRTSEAFCIVSKTSTLNHGGDSYIHDCLIANHIKKEGWYHPTAKNVDVIRELIKSHSKKGWLVLDPFMGSGTVALVCEQLRRKYIGYELDKEFCEIPKIRLQQKTLLSLTEKQEGGNRHSSQR